MRGRRTYGLAAALLGAAAVLTVARSGGRARVPGLAGIRARRRPGRDRAAPRLVLGASDPRPVARRLDVPRGARRLQPDLRRRAPPGDDAGRRGYFARDLWRDGARVLPHVANAAARDARRAACLDRPRRDDPGRHRRARPRGHHHGALGRALADRDPALRLRTRALARRPPPGDAEGARVVPQGGPRRGSRAGAGAHARRLALGNHDHRGPPLPPRPRRCCAPVLPPARPDGARGGGCSKA